MHRPEVSASVACSGNSEKVNVTTAAESAVVGNIVGALGRDFISYILFSHSRILDFTAGVIRSHWKVLRQGSYFSVKNSLGITGRGKAIMAALVQ